MLAACMIMNAYHSIGRLHPQHLPTRRVQTMAYVRKQSFSVRLLIECWEQVFWLVLEATAGNESSHSYVRLSSVVCYALALYVGAHFLLLRFHTNHHVLEILLDLATDVVGFAWINVAEEVLAQVFRVGAHVALLYCGFAVGASWGAMAIGTCARDCLNWPVDFEETANHFVAGSCALPTSWLITQAVHIALYGFFYRTSARAVDMQVGGRSEEVQVNVHFAASLFLLIYAMFCTIIASRVVGGTIAASAATDSESVPHDGTSTGPRSHGVLRAIEAGGPFSAPLASEVAGASDGKLEVPRQVHHGDTNVPATTGAASSAFPYPSGRRRRRSAPGDTLDAVDPPTPSNESNELWDSDVEGIGRREKYMERRVDEDGRQAQGKHVVDMVEAEARALGEAVAIAARTRGEALRRGGKTFLRLTLGMMVGWAYNLWGQVEFRQEELEFRYGAAIGAAIYAVISTALGVCIMVRGTDKLDAIGDRSSVLDSLEESVDADAFDSGGRRVLQLERGRNIGDQGPGLEKTTASHAQRMLVVVGGVSLMVGWAWEEAIDLFLEDILGDSTDLGAILAKLALACIATTAVLGGSLRKQQSRNGDLGISRAEGVGEVLGGDGREEAQSLMVPLIESTPPVEKS